MLKHIFINKKKILYMRDEYGDINEDAIDMMLHKYKGMEEQVQLIRQNPDPVSVCLLICSMMSEQMEDLKLDIPYECEMIPLLSIVERYRHKLISLRVASGKRYIVEQLRLDLLSIVGICRYCDMAMFEKDETALHKSVVFEKVGIPILASCPSPNQKNVFEILARQKAY
jgi:hypothetical protein